MAATSQDVGSRHAHRRMWIIIAALVVLWAAAMLFRWEIRARWWGYRLAHTDSPASRAYYFACLASIGDRAVGTAGRLLRNPSPEVRLEAVGILHRCRSERAGALLLQAMGDGDADVREAAALGLALHHDKAAMPSLLEMLRSDDADTALAAAVAMQHIGTPQAAAALVETVRTRAVGERSATLRAQAIDSLGLIGDRQAVPALIECLTDERPVTTRPAADRALLRAIEAIGPDLARQGLDPKSLAAMPAPVTVADLAARALQRITGESFGFRSTDPPERKDAVARMYAQWWESHRADAARETVPTTRPSPATPPQTAPAVAPDRKAR
ncbi:MAG: HEAT repeat domain-containing protein [Phycisphaerae bacterium]